MRKIKENAKNRNFTKLTQRGDISLIVLVITIIVIVILAAAVILTINNNNPVAEANKARYESDRANMQAVFTNVISKVMTHNRAVVSVTAGKLFNVGGGSLSINGGTYTSNTSGAGTSNNSAGAITLASNTTLNLNNTAIYAKDSDKGTIASVLGEANSTIIANNCTIESTSKGSLEAAGIRSLGDVKLTSSSVVAKSDYTANAAGTAYASNSRGVYCEGNLELYDCYVWGAHAGVTTKGDLTIDGGTYEGYGHGGIYCANDGIYCANDGKTLHIYNATFNWAEMKDGLISDSIAGTNGAGMYIGVENNFDASSTSVPDNCIITEESYAQK